MEVVKEGTGYLGTFLQGEYGDAYRSKDRRSPKCTVLTRHYRLTRSRSGKLNVHIKTDAAEFPDEDAMAAAIGESGWFELPAEADGNPRYVPPEYRDGHQCEADVHAATPEYQNICAALGLDPSA